MQSGRDRQRLSAAGWRCWSMLRPQRRAGRDLAFELVATDRTRWLVVLDDLANSGDMRKRWPSESTTGSGCRDHSPPRPGARRDHAETDHVDTFTPSESLAYLTRRCMSSKVRTGGRRSAVPQDQAAASRTAPAIDMALCASLSGRGRHTIRLRLSALSPVHQGPRQLK
jgi:hypothetical protein